MRPRWSWPEKTGAENVYHHKRRTRTHDRSATACAVSQHHRRSNPPQSLGGALPADDDYACEHPDGSPQEAGVSALYATLLARGFHSRAAHAVRLTIFLKKLSANPAFSSISLPFQILSDQPTRAMQSRLDGFTG